MYNKKCKTTYLFLLALLCLITLIVPFMNVGFSGDVSVFLKIIYYFTISIYSISIVGIILIGVFSLFRNNFTLISIQELLSFLSLFMIILNLLIFAPISKINLSVGYSILALETFVMALLDDIIKLIKRLPRTFREVKKEIEIKKQERLQRQALEAENQIVEVEENKEEEHHSGFEQTQFDFDEVKIIPPDDDMI